jgi:DNA-binding winged helix-turn-helix (wHTH) protein
MSAASPSRQQKSQESGRFEDFVLNTDTHELRRGGTEALQRRSSCSLYWSRTARRRSRRPQLQERLWPETFVVEKDLTNLIVEIRDALGDEAAEPMFVRTIYGYGYAFRAPVEGEAAERAPGRRSAVARLAWEGGRVTLVCPGRRFKQRPYVEGNAVDALRPCDAATLRGCYQTVYPPSIT